MAVWRKSSYSGENYSCVEVALGPVVSVRDTKARRAGKLTVSARAWRAALDRLR
ncbi:DUF397 domain-containing protein [Amycolatopsis rifamycinica]|uniref:Transcriptional regulator n=1 Tax=Amycolatopsis rifamycinica TaxID=287986 RepID=A0A066TY92_9PSEU|nr:DUF397 domain-containing protein [Amycolatopsis rifamycinica]KDN19805.1 transcriptional regulator [Amycolatopsis rifamycinica]